MQTFEVEPRENSCVLPLSPSLAHFLIYSLFNHCYLMFDLEDCRRNHSLLLVPFFGTIRVEGNVEEDDDDEEEDEE